MQRKNPPADPGPLEPGNRETCTHSGTASALHAGAVGKGCPLNNQCGRPEQWAGGPLCYIDGSHTVQLDKGAAHGTQRTAHRGAQYRYRRMAAQCRRPGQRQQRPGDRQLHGAGAQELEKPACIDATGGDKGNRPASGLSGSRARGVGSLSHTWPHDSQTPCECARLIGLISNVRALVHFGQLESYISGLLSCYGLCSCLRRIGEGFLRIRPVFPPVIRAHFLTGHRPARQAFNGFAVLCRDRFFPAAHLGHKGRRYLYGLR